MSFGSWFVDQRKSLEHFGIPVWGPYFHIRAWENPPPDQLAGFRISSHRSEEGVEPVTKALLEKSVIP